MQLRERVLKPKAAIAIIALVAAGLGINAATDGGSTSSSSAGSIPPAAVEEACYEVVAGDSFYKIATKLAPSGITIAQRNTFAAAIAKWNRLSLQSVIQPENGLCFNIADVPVAGAPVTTTSSSSTTTSSTVAPTTIAATTTTLAPTTTTAATTPTIPASAFLPVLASPFIVGGVNPNPTSEGEGNARFNCGYSHLNFDDAIVAPGVPGAAHLHQYFGNTGANANSTFESLRTSGRGTCDGDTENRSAYWAPALLQPDGRVAIPDFAAVYYKSAVAPTTTVVPPDKLVMIAGYDMAKGDSQRMYHTWSCDRNPGEADVKSLGTLDCPATANYPNGLMIAEVQFPECWDGINLDSPNHRDHMAYARDLPNGRCGGAYPVQIPQVSYKIGWSNMRQGSTMKLSSDTMPGMTHANGTTLHADWIGAWNPSTIQTFVVRCINGRLDCQDGNLGDGTKLRGYGYFGAGRYGSYTGPLIVDAPTRG